MNSITVLPAPLPSLFPFWIDSQTSLAQVERWSKYKRRNPELRRQTTDVHSAALTILASRILPTISEANDTVLDIALILTTCSIHDLGEGILKIDTHFLDKTVQGDVAEYEAFDGKYHGCDTGWTEWRKAFLLQFCLGDTDLFNETARRILLNLREEFYPEAVTFSAIEAFDYILYAIECWNQHKDEVILTHVLRNQPLRIEGFLQIVPGLSVIWTPQLRKWCTLFVEAHKHVPDEKGMNL
jgi:hypothetical protein